MTTINGYHDYDDYDNFDVLNLTQLFAEFVKFTAVKFLDYSFISTPTLISETDKNRIQRKPTQSVEKER